MILSQGTCIIVNGHNIESAISFTLNNNGHYVLEFIDSLDRHQFEIDDMITLGILYSDNKYEKDYYKVIDQNRILEEPDGIVTFKVILKKYMNGFITEKGRNWQELQELILN